MHWLNIVSALQSGYAEGVVSNNNVIFNDYGRPASIAVSSSHTLSLCRCALLPSGLLTVRVQADSFRLVTKTLTLLEHSSP